MSFSQHIPLIYPYRARSELIVCDRQILDQEAFLRAALALAERLPQQPYAINLCRDRYYFALGFCAALIRGTVTLLPPNRQPRTIAEIAADYPGCYLVYEKTEGVQDEWENLHSVDISTCAATVSGDNTRVDNTLGNTAVLQSSDNASGLEVPLIAGSQLAVIAFTSGSTGKPKPNPKPWFTLSGTARLLSQRFFNAADRRPVLVATVPSQHMYGLEMTVLMALQGRAVMHSSHPFYPGDVVAKLESVSAPAVLVTTPVHLRALIGAGIAPPGISKIISATAPLNRELARRAEQLFDAPVEEIFGCTEAGSMATRRTCVNSRYANNFGDSINYSIDYSNNTSYKNSAQADNQSEWVLLDGMQMLVDAGGYRVTGPQLDGERVLEDRFEKTGEQCFRLLGRSEDQINVAGKRASLADLTRRLLNIDGVRDALVFVNQDAERPAALVVSDLNVREILNAFSNVVDPVFLPRPLKKVRELPRNDTGKVTRELALQAIEDSH